jgi:hypothetical protein
VDSLIAAAARALAAGDPLGALKRVALRKDPPGLALRGIAMAQLGDFPRARALVRAAAHAFGAREAVARARCVVAEAEIALAARELTWPAQALIAARATLEAHGDRVNAAQAQCLAIRRLLLIGRIQEAADALAELDPQGFPPALRATHQLIAAGLAIRRLKTQPARHALEEAGRSARQAGIPALIAEVEGAARVLETPAAHLVRGQAQQPLLLEEVETLLASGALVIDACRHAVRRAEVAVPLNRRPVLFILARALAEAWPADVTRERLIARAFRTRAGDDSHRARLRVEVGRLRRLLKPLAQVTATPRGFRLVPHQGEVVVLAQPVEEPHGSLLAFLADGELWSSSALALAMGASQRTVQRSLDTLAAAGRVQAVGHGRARRWMTPPVGGFTTALLLPMPLPGG